MKKNILIVILLSALFGFPSVRTCHATVGMKETRNSSSAYDRVYDRFLNKDYEAVDRMAADYLAKGYDQPNAEDVLTLRAMALLKLGRSPEARAVFKEIEDHLPSAQSKARASVSIADSYLDENNERAAYEGYQTTLTKYPGSDQTDYASEKIRELGPRVKIETPAMGPLPQMSYEERHFYSVQVGSFKDPMNAQRVLGKLIRDKYDAYLAPDESNGRHRVRVGRLTTKEEAKALEARLRRDGYPTKLL